MANDYKYDQYDEDEDEDEDNYWGRRCQKCGSASCIEILATIEVQVLNDYVEISHHADAFEWDTSSPARCLQCKHMGTVADFDTAEDCD